MEHHYLITEEIEQIASLADGQRLPSFIDFEANLYSRQEKYWHVYWEPMSHDLLLGHWMAHHKTFGHDLLEPKLDNIADRLELAYERIPALANCRN